MGIRSLMPRCRTGCSGILSLVFLLRLVRCMILVLFMVRALRILVWRMGRRIIIG